MLFDGYAFDLDGTVDLGDAPLPGAVETIGRIRQAGRPVVFVTNNPLHSAEDYADKLCSLGVEATTADVVTARIGPAPALKFFTGPEAPCARGPCSTCLPARANRTASRPSQSARWSTPG